MTKQRKIIGGVAVVAFYGAAMLALTYAEASAADASIHTVWDALWYSVVTLTTVGYGDMYPVTPLGRLIGVAVVIGSLGLLSAIISGMIALMTGYMMPVRKLRSKKNLIWNIFTEDGRDARAMAESLSENEQGVTIFLKKGQDAKILCQEDAFWVNEDIAWILKQKREKSDCRLFCFGEDGWSNAAEGSRLAAKYDLPVYAMTQAKLDKAPENLTLFDRMEGTARAYWQAYPACQCERNIVLVGCGSLGTALLERAILTNVREGQKLTYTVIGDSREFQKLHPVICAKADSEVFADVLEFVPSLWEMDMEKLIQADRLIFCMDDPAENLAAVQKLGRQFALQAKVYIYGSDNTLAENATAFGMAKEVFEPEMVLQEKRSHLARKMNDLYRKSVNYPAPDWKELSEFYRQSNVAAADHLLMKCRTLLGENEAMGILKSEGEEALYASAYAAYVKNRGDAEKIEVFRKLEHDRWLRFYLIHNWEYSPVRSNANRKHPLIVPYQELEEVERRKDDSAWELLGDL